MAVSIDRVYQKVLALANKEQRGYITPQEFNLFADHAQMEIFEQYFYDLEQFERDASSDVDSLIEQKIQIFKQLPTSITNGSNLPANTHQIDSVGVVWDSGRRGIVERVSRGEAIGIESSPLLNTSLATCYYVHGNAVHFVDYTSLSGILPSGGSFTINLTRKPNKPEWLYVISGENALFNPGGSTDFELHSSEENKLVIKILALAGVAIKDVQLAQVAAGKEASITQQQKQ
jgi:hypothetical protein